MVHSGERLRSGFQAIEDNRFRLKQLGTTVLH